MKLIGEKTLCRWKCPEDRLLSAHLLAPRLILAGGRLLQTEGVQTEVVDPVKRKPPGWPGMLANEVKDDLAYTFFIPGNYKCSLQVRYWPMRDRKEIALKNLRDSHYDMPNYQIAAADLSVNVSAPEVVILLGAILGGIMAFLLGKLRGQEPTGVPAHGETLKLRLLRWASGALLAILLSVILTIMLFRLSDSPFPIKVSISDFWGAIIIGFVAAYSGGTLLDKYLARGSGQQSVAQGGNKKG